MTIDSSAPSLAELRAARLERAFFARDALVVSRALIGARLVHVLADGSHRVARIVETEAYRGPTDAACHARFGLTKRTRTLFGKPGVAYVFLIYGMHDCLNAVCMAEGAGHAALVRAVEPMSGIAPTLRGDGPGRLTRTLGITRAHDGVDFVTSDTLFIAVAGANAAQTVVATPRVGIAYAGNDALEPWRFLDGESRHVSRPSPRLIGLGAPVKPVLARPAARVPKRPAPAPQEPSQSSEPSARRRPSGTTPGTRRRDR